MKFLSDVREGQNLAPLKFMYDDNYNRSDILSIVYKDVDTGQHFVENIENPEIEIYITKKEYRDPEKFGKYMHDVHEVEKCDKYTCRYKWRKQFAAKILGIPAEEVMTCPYVANIDVDICNWYHIQFLKEYPYHGIIPIKVGYFDIETDIIETRVIGACPIVCITYISETTNTVYNLSVTNEKYKKFDMYRDNIQKFIDECKESFSLYNAYTNDSEWSYECEIFQNEADMLTAFWKLVHILDDDYMVAWNAPFDVISIVERMNNIGLNTYQDVCDPRFKFKKIDIEEDTQIMVTKRRHKFDITVIPTVACLMTMYGNVNSARARIPTFKLNAIADTVLKDRKVEYAEEYGDIMSFLYADFYMFNKYNIKDVFLMIGINHEAHVIDDTFSRTYMYGIQFPAVFSSNNMLPSVLMIEMEAMGLIVGVNRNRLNEDNSILQFFFENEDEMTEDELQDMMDEINSSLTLKEGEKFAGAIVQDPRRMSSTGYKLNGAPAQYVHVWCIDMDITSEYPTAMCLMNMSNDTLVAKIMLVNDDDIKLPMYDAYELFKGEESTYNCNKAAVAAETIAQRDFILAGKMIFGLPDAVEVEELLDIESLLSNNGCVSA